MHIFQLVVSLRQRNVAIFQQRLSDDLSRFTVLTVFLLATFFPIIESVVFPQGAGVALLLGSALGTTTRCGSP